MDADDTKQHLASELHCHWVGPMPINDFLKTFLKIGRKGVPKMPTLADNYFDAMPHTTKEPEMYQPFIDLVTNARIAPTFELVNTSNKSDPQAGKTMQNRPDITAYDLNADIPAEDCMSYSHAEILIEFKPAGKTVDPFEDLSAKGTTDDLRKYLFEAPAEARRECRGQLASYARAWMASHYRTHCFVVYLGDPWARIVRFDRSGAIATERFNIRSDSRPLLQFLWRMSWADDEVRGKDPTVSVVTDPKVINLAKKKLMEWAPDRSRRVLKLQIPDGGPAGNPNMREVLVWGPLADPWCVIGRATRGYPAWDLKDKKHVFVKDCWRVIDNEISKETDILKTLKKAGVCNVPQFLYGDDLPGQLTSTQDFADAKWNKGGRPENFSTRSHIRFSTNLIGIPLTKFKSSKGLVQAWLDALIAHEDAFTKCKILHRDISLNNILIQSDGTGFLNDWDLARTLDDIDNGPCQPSRSGTWQFMSIFLLGEPDKKHTLQDDLEAFFWVLTIRFLETTLVDSDKSIPKLMSIIFDTAQNNGSETVGGDPKTLVVQQRKHIGTNFRVKNNVPLSQLILDILRIIKLYITVSTDLEDEVATIASENDISLKEAEDIYLKSKKSQIDGMRSHRAIRERSLNALGKTWPTNEKLMDHLEDPPTTESNKRPGPALDNGPTEVPRAAKRSKTKQ